MNEDDFNLELRKFLKKVGITSQREIEKAVRAQLESGKFKGGEKMRATMVLEVPELDLRVEISDSISLER